MNGFYLEVSYKSDKQISTFSEWILWGVCLSLKNSETKTKETQE